MHALLHRGRAALALQLLLGLAALSVAAAAPHRDTPKPRLALSSAGGALAITNSKNGATIFRAQDMRPGEEASGSVRIGNASAASAVLSLSRTTAGSDPGTGGGSLESRLQLLVIDKTHVQLPVTVYAGNAIGLQAVDLGTFAPVETRGYLFVATLPDRRDGTDNAYQGASLTLNFAWTARQPALAAPSPAPSPAPTAPARQPAPPTPALPRPAAIASPESMIVLPSARTCIKRRFILLKLRPRTHVAITGVDVRVGKHTSRHYPGSRTRFKIPVKARTGRAIRIKVTLHRATGAPLVLSRTYRVCRARRPLRR
jgi:spore coat-associated protein N